MKKILIALPLVLIMVLSMVPVMAAFNGKVQLTINVYNDPLDDSNKDEFSLPLEVDEETAKSEDKLKAFLVEYVKEKYPEDNYRIDVAASSVIPYSEEQTEVTEPDEDPAEGDTSDAPEQQQASGTIVVRAKCSPDPEEPEVTECVTLCEEITIELYDMYNKETLDKYTKTYGVRDDQVPDQAGLVEHYLNNFFPYGSYQLFYGWNTKPLIMWMSEVNDCTIVIKVLPKYEYIQIVHELFDCCITPDGEVKYELWRSFVEDDQRWFSRDGVMEIPFLDFHTDLMINQEKAAEYAKTRLEKINAMDFVFQGAKFYDGINLTSYMTGKVTDFAGNVMTISNDVPTIVLTYYRGECVQEEEVEEKVDDAKLVAGAETTAPATQQLPATGAKDITAFFMSAVALLGLGIFFAKRR